MIDLYYWTTPNGHKMTMFLEESGLPYVIHPVNINKGEQFAPEFLKISPNNRIPASDVRGRVDCLQWLVWQVANLGPFAGQNHHFVHYAPEKIPYAIDRYVRETGRLYAVLNKRLANREFIVGDYSIADIASYTWVLPERQSQDINEFPHLKRWKEAIKARPATIRAYAKAQEINPKTVQVADDEAAKKILFGQSKETVR